MLGGGGDAEGLKSAFLPDAAPAPPHPDLQVGAVYTAPESLEGPTS